jgi:methionine synthase I (cobalamin-dependent)/5,10-methylenetetrahydrofolate reductase
MTIFECLKNSPLITDGAMGTYYASLTGEYEKFCELANLVHPEIVQRIHREYIQAGARLIRTNTFSANPVTLNLPREKVRELLVTGWELAREAAAGTGTLVAANIGPIPDPLSPDGPYSILDEYLWLIDTFREAGATVFNFETFGSPEYLPEITAYLKRRQPDAFVLTQFAITSDGYSRKGISATRLVSRVKAIKTIDAYGFNCGAGPTHLYQSLLKMGLSGDILAALPNAGYPEVVNERTLYIHNPEYFAERMLKIKDLGVQILGGCCGTTPVHIRALTGRLGSGGVKAVPNLIVSSLPEPVKIKVDNSFAAKLEQGRFVVAAELDPPFDTGIAKTLDRAAIYRNAGVDIITIADSPLAKARADSAVVSAKIKREIGIETMPHLCCRDKNLNAIKATVLAAHFEGIRNILAVTGDPLPHESKNGIKSVFNLNAIELLGYLAELNAALFGTDGFALGGALNLNALHKEGELQRMSKKVDRGATFFLTQPIFEDSVIEFLPRIVKPSGVKILAGILPIVNYNNALFLQNEVPGMALSATLMNRFSGEMSRDQAEQVGIELALEIARKIRPYVDGFYFITPFNRAAMVAEILKRLGFSRPPEK